MLAGPWCFALLALAPGEGSVVGPPAPGPVVVRHRPELVGPPAILARPSPDDFWMLSSLEAAASVARNGDELSLDAALCARAPVVEPPPPGLGRTPSIEMDRLAGLNDVVGGLDDLRLSQPPRSAWSVSYSSCGSLPRLRSSGWFPRCLP